MTAPGTSTRRPAGPASARPARAGPHSDCNNKLIGARWFVAGFTANATSSSGDFLSAARFGRPRHAHGDDRRRQPGAVLAERQAARICQRHGAARAARDLQGLLAGARRAIRRAARSPTRLRRLTPRLLTAWTSSASRSARRFDFDDPQDIAFLGAADAGVFVAQAAGNEGPGVSTTAAGEPWVTTVAASTHSGLSYRPGDCGSIRPPRWPATTRRSKARSRSRSSNPAGSSTTWWRRTRSAPARRSLPSTASP